MKRKKPTCDKCGRTDYADIRGRLCDRCAFPKRSRLQGSRVMLPKKISDAVRAKVAGPAKPAPTKPAVPARRKNGRFKKGGK